MKTPVSNEIYPATDFLKATNVDEENAIMESQISDKIGKVYETETMIDPDDTLYLMTWSPNPEDLPDADFETQHRFCYNTIADYLVSCRVGLFCVEATQKGNPHYHGWYQLSHNPDLERLRIACVKAMTKFGMLKITPSIGHYKINNYWTDKANCLYYYKKDLLMSMFWVKHNPIDFSMRDETIWSDNKSLFVKQGVRQSCIDLEHKVTQQVFYREFYFNRSI